MRAGLAQHARGGGASVLFGQPPVLDAGAVDRSGIARNPKTRRGFQAFIYRHAAVFFQREAVLEVSGRLYTHGHNHQIRRKCFTVLELHAVRSNLACLGFCLHGNAICLVQRQDGPRRVLTELFAERLLRPAYDRRLQAARRQRGGGLKRDEAVADQHHALAFCFLAEHRVNAFHVAPLTNVEDMRQVLTGDTKLARRAAWCQQSGIKMQFAAVLGAQGALFTIQ